VGRHVAELMTMLGVEAYAVHGPGRCRANQGARGPAERLPDAERLVLHDDHGGTCLGAVRRFYARLAVAMS